MSLSRKSTVYTDSAEKGVLTGFTDHDEPEKLPLPPFDEETALKKVDSK